MQQSALPYPRALVCAMELKPLVCYGSEFEGIEPANHRPLRVDPAFVSLQKNTVSFSGFLHFENVGRPSLYLLCKFRYLLPRKPRYSFNFALYKQYVPLFLLSVSAADSAPRTGEAYVLRIAKLAILHSSCQLTAYSLYFCDPRRIGRVFSGFCRASS